MKTVKIILSIVGFALTSISFGQLLNQNDESTLKHTLSYNTLSMHIEHQLDDYLDQMAFGDQFHPSWADRNYTVSFEADLQVEDWMITPFFESFYEEELTVEPWMTVPFKSSSELDPELYVEDWMITSWI